MWLEGLGDVRGENAELERCVKGGAGGDLSLGGEREREPGGAHVHGEGAGEVGEEGVDWGDRGHCGRFLVVGVEPHC